VVAEGFILGLFAAFTFGIADFIATIVARRLGLIRLLVVTHVAAVVLATPYLVFRADLHGIPLAYWPVFGAVSLLVLGTLVSFYKALQTGPVALVSPTVSAHIVIVILLSVLVLGEQIGIFQIVGVAAAVGGVMLASFTLDRSHRGTNRPNKALMFALAAAVGAGFFVFTLGILSREVGWFLAIYVVRLIGLGIVLAAQRAVRSQPWKEVPIKLILAAALVGALQIVGLAAYTIGAQIGMISVVATTFSVYPIIPMVGGLVLLREKLASRQAVGLASVLTGLLVLGMAS
jgi:drug/metabolite transporter (DMT)-like permease